MLPKKNRVSKKDFPSSKIKGFRGFSPLFSIVFYSNSSQKGTEARVAIVVSKKTARTAVSRNTLRRRFYEAIGLFLPQLSGKIETIVIYPKKEAEKIDFGEIKKEIEKSLKHTRLI